MLISLGQLKIHGDLSTITNILFFPSQMQLEIFDHTAKRNFAFFFKLFFSPTIIKMYLKLQRYSFFVSHMVLAASPPYLWVGEAASNPSAPTEDVNLSCEERLSNFLKQLATVV